LPIGVPLGKQHRRHVLAEHHYFFAMQIVAFRDETVLRRSRRSRIPGRNSAALRGNRSPLPRRLWCALCATASTASG
jgi:predicted NAD-dependent protein-ADP-ribosyltransferase YbiA (DUF1768 family)